MGNIEMIDSKRKPIFPKRQKSPLASSRSPYSIQRKLNYSPLLIKSVVRDVPKCYSPLKQRKQKPFEPILEKQFKKSSISYTSKSTYTPKTVQKSYFEKNKFYDDELSEITQRKSRNLHYENQKVYQENKTKCEDIIKKVRNFNDFLNEVKKKMKYQEEQNSFITSRIQDNSKRNSTSKSISLLLKLENEKLELQKYKRLVERQLSKQHSIQSISIENKDEKQKILKINYENTPQLSTRTMNKNTIKEKYQEVVKKVQELGQIIDSEDEKKKRVKNINTLMAKLEVMHSDQVQREKQIERMIKIDDSDDD